MNEFLRKILIRITGIGWCDTPNIQMAKEKEGVMYKKDKKE